MDYIETHKVTCPKDKADAIHTIVYNRSTCTRIADTLERFSCSKDSRCQTCIEDYIQ